MRYGGIEQRQRSTKCCDRCLVKELARPHSPFNVAGVEFVRLRIDGEDGDVWITCDERGHILPDVTADGERRDGQFVLGHFGRGASTPHVLDHRGGGSLLEVLGGFSGSIP